jgi:hypothetical protein
MEPSAASLRHGRHQVELDLTLRGPAVAAGGAAWPGRRRRAAGRRRRARPQQFRAEGLNVCFLATGFRHVRTKRVPVRHLSSHHRAPKRPGRYHYAREPPMSAPFKTIRLRASAPLRDLIDAQRVALELLPSRSRPPQTSRARIARARHERIA